MKRPRLKNPLPVANILDRMFKNKGFGKKLVQYSVFEIWSDVVGSTIAAKTTPRKMQGDTLVVTTTSAAWANELSFMKPVILKKIQEKIPEIEIKDIRFTANSK